MGNPCYMYKEIDGSVVNELFDDEKIPDGWYENKQLARAANIPKKRKRKVKVVADGNSSGLDQQFSETGGNISGRPNA